MSQRIIYQSSRRDLPLMAGLNNATVYQADGESHLFLSLFAVGNDD